MVTINKAMPTMIRRAIRKGLIVIGPDGDWYEHVEGSTYYNHVTDVYVDYVNIEFKVA